MNASAARQVRRDTPLRIAVVTSSYPSDPRDPNGHFVAAEAYALAAGGHSVTVLCPGQSRVDEQAPVRVIRLGASGLFAWPGALEQLRKRPWLLGAALPFAHRARKMLAELGPFERVVAHWIVPCGWPIAFDSDASLEVVAHGSDVRLLLGLPAPLRRYVLAALLRHGAQFRFVSHELRNALVAQSPELAARSSVRASDIVVDGAPNRAQARRQLGIAARTRLCVVVARLVPAKRVAVALGALALVPSCSVVVVGDGPEREPLVRDFPGARFVGHLPRDRTLAWIAAADLLISASRREGAPTVVREARALGVPVVAAPAGDLEQWSAADPEIVLVR
ncbi:MAG: glycosyltransferase family 4 protein [Polyangiaceae bacterium]|nr:glycosyltransferase family 4 protein [Polyangiaceae bacterium]